MVLESERLSSTYEVDGSIVDRIQLFITGNSGAFVQNLVISDLDAWSGEALFSRLKVGNLTINNSNLVGDGSGVDDPSCYIDSSVLATSSGTASAPVLIWPAEVATARSAMVESSVSPER